MTLTIVAGQMAAIEQAVILQKVPAIARRLRQRFPQTFSAIPDAALLQFAAACARQALALGDLTDPEQAWRLAAVNAQIPRIDADPDARRYFDAVAGSPSLPGGRKIDRLHRDLSRWFEAAPPAFPQPHEAPHG